ncbi:hypothetical protein GCM10023201_40860 [Actinomycetospora corticicola]|uniref:Peptidase S74 domain-containing protein n=1 Tax=Actinomycetospora corticicola TaxID=663602 RepID=A0A7Y9DWK5_9PSEU|nr:hypothetical protein [Actinomycetospora corticicola]NYD36830.1 hypothetical protein [Actinomycetospora corticicola]
MTAPLGSATSTGADKLADKLNQRRAEDHQSTFTTAQVVAGSTDRQVAVDMDGDTQLWPFVAGYTPRSGDAVVLGGGPGWWVCLGSISGVGPARASTQQVYDLTVDHDVAVGHELIAQGGIRTEAGISSGGDATFSGVMTAPLRARGANWSSSLYNGAIRWESTGALEVKTYDGSAFRGVYASNFAPPPSWREYKLDLRALADVLGGDPGDVLDRIDVATSWMYRETVSFADGEERIGPKLDELPDALIVRSYDEDTGEDRSSWSVNGMVTVLIAEVQALRRRVAELEESR